jgi:hypothetical protein
VSFYVSEYVAPTGHHCRLIVVRTGAAAAKAGGAEVLEGSGSGWTGMTLRIAAGTRRSRLPWPPSAPVLVGSGASHRNDRHDEGEALGIFAARGTGIWGEPATRTASACAASLSEASVTNPSTQSLQPRAMHRHLVQPGSRGSGSVFWSASADPPWKCATSREARGFPRLDEDGAPGTSDPRAASRKPIADSSCLMRPAPCPGAWTVCSC